VRAKVVWAGVVAVLTLALAPVLMLPEVRTAYVNALALRRAKVIQPRYLFVGDSITANGGIWGWRMSIDPLSAVVAARPEYTTRQMFNMASGAPPAHTAFIMAGTNDVPDSTPEQFGADLSRLLAAVKAERIVVTLIPPTSDRARNRKAAPFIRTESALLQRLRIPAVNLWPQLAPSGVLLPQYSVDGIHFNDAGYKVWSQALRKSAG
jgi:hypothetical protein